MKFMYGTIFMFAVASLPAFGMIDEKQKAKMKKEVERDIKIGKIKLAAYSVFPCLECILPFCLRNDKEGLKETLCENETYLWLLDYERDPDVLKVGLSGSIYYKKYVT